MLHSLPDFSHSAGHNQIGPSWCFPGGWVCVRSSPLWVSPMNSPVRLGVSPAAPSTPNSVFNQRFDALFPPCWSPGLHGLLHSPANPPSLSMCKCGATGSASCSLACPIPQSATLLADCHQSSPPQLPICAPPTGLDECSLSPWLSDFHTVRFSVSSGCFLFLNCCPSFGCARRHSVSTYASILAGSPQI